MNYISALMVMVALSTSSFAEETKADARGAVEDYVTAALAGKIDDAIALAVEGQSPAKKKRIEEFSRLVGVKALKITSVLASEKQGEAVAVSESVKLTKANPDGRATGVLVFALVKSGDKWLVKDIDFRSEDAAKEKVKGFEKKNSDAKEISGKSSK